MPNANRHGLAKFTADSLERRSHVKVDRAEDSTGQRMAAGICVGIRLTVEPAVRGHAEDFERALGRVDATFGCVVPLVALRTKGGNALRRELMVAGGNRPELGSGDRAGHRKHDSNVLNRIAVGNHQVAGNLRRLNVTGNQNGHPKQSCSCVPTHLVMLARGSEILKGRRARHAPPLPAADLVGCGPMNTRLLAVLLIVAGSPALGSAQGRSAANPIDREVRQLATQVVRDARRPQGIVRMMEIDQLYTIASPGTTDETFARLERNRRLPAHLRAYASMQRAYGLVHAGHPNAGADKFDELGFVRQWRVIGPFDNEGKAGFNREYPPEALRNQDVVADGQYPGRERPVQWRAYPEGVTRYGYVDLDAVLRPYVNVCGFAETFVHREREEPISLWLGAAGAAKIYFNGTKVFEEDIYDGATADRNSVMVAAVEGWNRILVKSCTADGQWGFFLRVADRSGAPLSDLRADPRGADRASGQGNTNRLPSAPPGHFEALQAAVERNDSSAANHYNLARYLWLSGTGDPAENPARQHAERAAELDDRVDHLLFAANLAETRAEKMRFVELAAEASRNDPRVMVMQAALVAGGPDGGRALRMLDLPLTSRAGMKAAALRAAMLRSRGLNLTALAITQRAREVSGGSLRWRTREIELLDALGQRDESHRQREALLNLEYDEFGYRRHMINDALHREDNATALRHLDAMRTVLPGDADTLYYAASVYEGMGRTDDAIAIYRQVVALAPDEPDYHVRYGNALLRFGQEGAATQAFRQALALRPQDASTRRLLERIEPTERPDEAYATALGEILERRRDEQSWPATRLQDLSVATVHPNGLSSEFRQIAFQVHTDEGARRHRSHTIVFEPGLQFVDIRSAKVIRRDGSVVESYRTAQRNLANPAYRIYYDTRALVVQFPELQPGDSVELRYRIEDVSRRNAFNDYYGDLRVLQAAIPIVNWEHVLITPSEREFHVNRPQLRSFQHERESTDGQRIDRFKARNLEPLRRESNMPGITEIAPYLHVSTYQSWEDVGRWWWGLAQDQFHHDASLERTVNELIAGANDTRTKVQRIYRWVVENVRYVGLEFGIHGFKPYRIAQILQRGFGDCKDTASLLYAMLKIAGVEARIALIRTRDLGAITDEPASLAVFNHAIAYVPELDLFLDGTTDTSGMNELPTGDQGTTTLLVGPNDATLRQTPLVSADRERRERRLRIQLASDGSAQVEGSELVSGWQAARYRSTYQAAGMRDERLQREIARQLPGVELESQRFGNLDNFEAPVSFEYRIRAPQMAQHRGSEMELPGSVLASLVRSLANTPSRIHPLEVGPPSSYYEERTITLPSNHRFLRVPSGGHAQSPFGSLRMQYERQGTALRVTTELRLEQARVSPDEYPAFRRFIEEADRLTRERIAVGGAS